MWEQMHDEAAWIPSNFEGFTKAISDAFSSPLDRGESDRKWRNPPNIVDRPRRNPLTEGSTKALA